ncbi:bifunctional 2-polyprenyl-6-hydroxyphenol methylase/3-demethylubiquinol 3-O-methyltransferase UbiG [Mesonia sp. K7]|uniref:class I SAM-dependent methyltransferase n=1 Tax=Mesonia sp. K7 TaxID=2218606 RepID=UPI000DA98A9E|nr:class I SAM-dependent methyltransferase [Mesonia sp. K7]PZD77028.1 SAM-dependent methyltransferase [Mesonia sp. K7]
MNKEPSKWYASWFNTPYYHILYKDRDYAEAQLFMRNLTKFLKLPQHSTILDLACGKGRHSVYLHELGYDVTGVDLSENSIASAKAYEKPGLHFEVHDMSVPMVQAFDLVVNLFTSFGYFENEEDNYNTIKAIKQNLKPNGFGVIDFMNVKKVMNNLVAQETKTVGNIDFHIRRSIENGFIYKEINFEDNQQNFSFTEKVKALCLEDFKSYFEQAGITLKHTFGDYHLNNFEEESSDRLILVFQ